MLLIYGNTHDVERQISEMFFKIIRAKKELHKSDNIIKYYDR